MKYLSIQEYATWKGVTYEAVRKRTAKGTLPSETYGKKMILIKLSKEEEKEYERYINQRPASRTEL